MPSSVPEIRKGLGTPQDDLSGCRVSSGLFRTWETKTSTDQRCSAIMDFERYLK
jgi:hypothetical protein